MTHHRFTSNVPDTDVRHQARKLTVIFALSIGIMIALGTQYQIVNHTPYLYPNWYDLSDMLVSFLLLQIPIMIGCYFLSSRSQVLQHLAAHFVHLRAPSSLILPNSAEDNLVAKLARQFVIFMLPLFLSLFMIGFAVMLPPVTSQLFANKNFTQQALVTRISCSTYAHVAVILDGNQQRSLHFPESWCHDTAFTQLVKQQVNLKGRTWAFGTLIEEVSFTTAEGEMISKLV